MCTVAVGWFAERNSWPLDKPFYSVIALFVPLSLLYITALSRAERALLAFALSLALIMLAFMIAAAVDQRLALSWRGFVGAAVLGILVGLNASLLIAVVAGEADIRPHDT